MPVVLNFIDVIHMPVVVNFIDVIHMPIVVNFIDVFTCLQAHSAEHD